MGVWAVGGWGLPDSFTSSSWYVPATMATVIVFFIVSLTVLSRHSETSIPVNATYQTNYRSTHQTLIKPARVFQRNGTQFALTLLGFIFLFKIGEAFLGRMSIVFYKEIGFTSTQIAFYSKTLTWVITLDPPFPPAYSMHAWDCLKDCL